MLLPTARQGIFVGLGTVEQTIITEREREIEREREREREREADRQTDRQTETETERLRRGAETGTRREREAERERERWGGGLTDRLIGVKRTTVLGRGLIFQPVLASLLSTQTLILSP